MNKEIEQDIYLIVGANGFVGSYMIKNILERTEKKYWQLKIVYMETNTMLLTLSF